MLPAIMDRAALTPSKKGKKARTISNSRQLPWELIEEILLNLPHKSVVRFSGVSKLWNSMILDPVFARKHKNHAALLRRHRLVVYLQADFSDFYEDASFYTLAPLSSHMCFNVTVKPHISRDGDGDDRLSFPFSSVFSDTNIDFDGQFEEKPYILTCCDELWCVVVNMSLYLWNPSMRNIVKLPPPSSVTYLTRDLIYGLGYDNVNDDYKILKIRKHPPSRTAEAELYSLKRNCWRNLESFSSDGSTSLNQQRCEFVEGKFHWIGLTTEGAPIIASFDLSTEKYGEVAQPQYDGELIFLEVVALRGMLCVSLTYTWKAKFVLWVMEEYGVEKSWTKMFDIILSPRMVMNDPQMMKPLCLFDNKDLLVKIYEFGVDQMYIITYGNGNAKPMEIVNCGDFFYYQADAFLYVESLITLENFSKNSPSM